jgi:hypothetical protein
MDLMCVVVVLGFNQLVETVLAAEKKTIPDEDFGQFVGVHVRDVSLH